jgi:hypothetical protein
MNAEYVSAVIHGRLADALAPRGFVRNGEWFSREADGVRQSVGVALVDYEPEFRITIVFGLRAHAAERIFAQFWGASDDKPTCSFNLNQLAPEIEEDIVVRDKRMLKSALARLIPPLERTALPLLDALRDVASIERLFNSTEPVIRLSTPGPYRSMSAIILAHLTRNPDRDRLTDEYRPQVERCAGKSSLEHYDRLVEYLKGRAPGET